MGKANIKLMWFPVSIVLQGYFIESAWIVMHILLLEGVLHVDYNH